MHDFFLKQSFDCWVKIRKKKWVKRIINQPAFTQLYTTRTDDIIAALFQIVRRNIFPSVQQQLSKSLPKYVFLLNLCSLRS